jgi:cyclic pyranopterin phosphate synthase
MSDTRTPVTRVLAGIDAARHHGLTPVKINMVVQRGVNDHCVVPMARWARREGLELRFIEYMDVGCSNGWQSSDVVPADELRERIHQVWPLVPIDGGQGFETAQRFHYGDGRGSVGFIASISQPFCSSCTRARVSSRGDLHTCLFAPAVLALRELVRAGADLRAAIGNVWRARTDRYSELRAITRGKLTRPEMSAIGG